MNRTTLLSAARSHGSFAFGAVLLALFAGCGGKVLVDAPTGSGSGSGGAGGSASSSSTSSASNSSSNSGMGPGAGGASMGSSVVSGSVGVGPSTGSVSGSAVSSSVSTGSGPPPPPINVFCNNQPCQTGEVCCVNAGGPGDHCGQAGTCGNGFVELSCHGPSDCPGEVCCGHLDPNPMMGMLPYTGMACAPTCTGPNEIIACAGKGGGDSVCGPGTSCHQSQALGQGYRVCK